MPSDDEKQTVDPDALLSDDEDGEGDEEEISDPEEFIAAALSEMMETGVPIRFVASAQDPFMLPLIRRLHRQNEILADISATLRAVARKMGCDFQPDKVLKTADLNKS